MDDENTTKKTLWHQILGRIFEFLLTPLGITVSTNVDVMANPPKADILLLKRLDQNWTEEQLERLPDGIRESNAPQILIEFKATESLSKETFIQAAAYEHFYKQSQELKDEEIQTFVLCAIQPQKANREQYGYHIQVRRGVYQSDNIAFSHITLISLNELPDELHNAWVTCLASKKLKRLNAFNRLKSEGFDLIPKPFKWFLAELWQLISIKGDDDMTLDLSPQQIEDMGQMWGDILLPTIPLEKRLAGANPVEVINLFKQTNQLGKLSFSEIEELEFHLKNLKQQKKG
ncbi:MAG: hypothetical protein DRR08_02220 [Candidatus Parabeggiatoa sp. nov. 2]|nr:MAG: hypothetical protein B6247_01510 [Beggiatoa sp. 4572_84]RKZ63907.1 MAG: hypothetical protein DRR08_02220 [Gammaproteobacteria bacterium]